MSDAVVVLKNVKDIAKKAVVDNNILFEMDVEKMLDKLPEVPMFDLVVTSPPYDIGKSYEKKCRLMSALNGNAESLTRYIPALKTAEVSAGKSVISSIKMVQ